jgi:hypothetical protein
VARHLHETRDMRPHETLASRFLTTVTGGFPGQGLLDKVVKKAPLVSVPYKVFESAKSGLDASRSYTAEERAHGFAPSGWQQFGAGALNATSTFIDKSMYGLPHWILNNTRPK